MDFTPILNQIYGNLWHLVPFFVIATLFKSSWFKGVFGGFIVNLSAKLFLDKEKYHLIKNVALTTEDGSTQTDHVIVSKYGIFVVETKNMKGWAFGSPNQKTWTQKIYKHSSKFQNPLHKNYKHTKTLESLLELNGEQVFSVIVFVGDSTFKTEMPEDVTYGKGYIRFIKSKAQPVLTESEVKDITSKIESGRLTPSFKTNREQVKHVKTMPIRLTQVGALGRFRPTVPFDSMLRNARPGGGANLPGLVRKRTKHPNPVRSRWPVLTG